MGGFAIITSIRGELNLSVLLIFIAALLDRFDGMTARKLNIESELGEQLDSMSDIISFGVAPAILLYQGILFEFGAPGAFFTIFYIACGAFRLARFNISDNNGYFTGLPITAAGCIATLSFLINSVFLSTVFSLSHNNPLFINDKHLPIKEGITRIEQSFIIYYLLLKKSPYKFVWASMFISTLLHMLKIFIFI